MAAIFMLAATVLITLAVRLVANSSREAKQKSLYVGEAESVAKAGVVDALGWFSRQTANSGVVFGNTQDSFVPGQTPTVNPTFISADDAFDPRNNTANAQLSDTIDQNIGIVKEYPLDSPVTADAVFWARYEVWKQDAPSYTPGAYNPNAVHDITGQRDTAHVNGDGYVWSIVSKGYVYKRMDKSVDPTTGNWVVPYNEPPNQVVATAIYGTEFRKLSLLLPEPTPGNSNAAALYVQNIASQVKLSSVETTLNGSVSTYGNYAAIAMTSP